METNRFYKIIKPSEDCFPFAKPNEIVQVTCIVELDENGETIDPDGFIMGPLLMLKEMEEFGLIKRVSSF